MGHREILFLLQVMGLQCWLTLYNKFRFLIHQLQYMDHLEIWKEISNKKCLEFLKNYSNSVTLKSLQEFL